MTLRRLDRSKPPPGWHDSWDGPFAGPAAALEGPALPRISRGHWEHGRPTGEAPDMDALRAEDDVIAEAWKSASGFAAPYIDDALAQLVDRLHSMADRLRMMDKEGRTREIMVGGCSHEEIEASACCWEEIARRIMENDWGGLK